MTASPKCKVCRRTFGYGKAKTTPEICGQLACRARHEWTAEDWAGAARMATARQRAGIVLTDLDYEALDRAARTTNARTATTMMSRENVSAPAPALTGRGPVEPAKEVQR